MTTSDNSFLLPKRLSMLSIIAATFIATSVTTFMTPGGGTKMHWCCIKKWRQKLPLGLIWPEWAQTWILYYLSHIFHPSAICGYWAVCNLSCPCCLCTVPVCESDSVPVPNKGLYYVFIEWHRKDGMGFSTKTFKSFTKEEIIYWPQLTQTST